MLTKQTREALMDQTPLELLSKKKKNVYINLIIFNWFIRIVKKFK